MTFGMPTLMEITEIEKTVALCGELGLSFVELNTNFPLHQPHLLNASQLNRLAEKFDVGYTIHLNDEMAVAEFHPAVSGGYRQAVAETIALAKQIGAKKLNMHLSDGAKYTMPDRIVYFYEAYLQEYLEQTKVFRDMCETAVDDSGIRICMENTNGFRNYQLAALDILLDSPVFGLTMDIGHNYCAGNGDEAWIFAHQDRLHHMHVHDAKNRKNDHLALGEGELDLQKYLTLAKKQDCSVVLEVKTVAGLRKSIDWVKSAGYLE
ncbi:MAG: sugar phosphate isomerase/epimerase [Ruminococcaceae bacterium]|nr:sugar phosphate isomerase/epimerase [Oscillospiraceae bacterium]